MKKYSNVFATSDKNIGRTDLVQHNIETSDARPIRRAPRRLPMLQQEDCEKDIKDMLDKGDAEHEQNP